MFLAEDTPQYNSSSNTGKLYNAPKVGNPHPTFGWAELTPRPKTMKVISMEAEQLNALSNQLKDLRTRTNELRRYL